MASEAHFTMPFHPGTAASTPFRTEDNNQDQDGAGSATEDEGFGRGVGKGWLGELDG